MRHSVSALSTFPTLGHSNPHALHTPSTSISPSKISASMSSPDKVSNPLAVMAITTFWKKFNIRQAVNFFVNAWNNTMLAIVRHGWSALLPELKPAEPEMRQVSDPMNEVLKAVCSVPAPQDLRK